MANGAGPYLFINGDLDQEDGNAVKGARPAFQFHKDHEELYVRQESAARVLLLEGEGGGRGGRDGDTSAQEALHSRRFAAHLIPSSRKTIRRWT